MRPLFGRRTPRASGRGTCLAWRRFPVATVIGCATLWAVLWSGAHPPRPRPSAADELRVSIVTLDPATFDSSGVTIRFENRSAHEIRLLRPLDGSDRGWIQPHYQLTVKTLGGLKILPLKRECALIGLWANTRWPDDYLVALLPGGAWEMRLRSGYRPSKGRSYLVSFAYTFEPPANIAGQPRRHLEYPESLWSGTASSAPELLEFRTDSR